MATNASQYSRMQGIGNIKTELTNSRTKLPEFKHHLCHSLAV